MRNTSSAQANAIASVTLLAAFAACSDSTNPTAARSARISESVASAFPLATATVHVVPGLDGMIPTAINDSDEVVGYTGAFGSFRTFRWTAAKGASMLSLGDNSEVQAAAVNDHGVIGGTGAAVNFGATRAVAWLPDGTIRDLPLYSDSADLEVAPNGCTISGMNIYAAIVGTCIAHGTFQIGTRFFWHNTASGESGAEYTSISDDGWIGAAIDMEFNIDGPFIISPAGETIILKGHDGRVHTGSAVNAVTHHGFAAGYRSEGGCQQAVAWLNHPGQSYPEFRMGVCGQSTASPPTGT